MQLINGKVELKLRRAKHCVVTFLCDENSNAMLIIIILFLLSKTQNYIFLLASLYQQKTIKTSQQRI